MATSTSSAPARPTMSAPTPLAGNSTTWAIAAPSSPTTTSAACRAAAPGHDPVPLAVAKTVTGQPYSIGFRATPARAGHGDYAHMMARRLVLCAAALLATACTRMADGTALPGLGAGTNLS